MLCESLQRHSDVTCAMEIFNPRWPEPSQALKDRSHDAWRESILRKLYDRDVPGMVTDHRLDETRFDLRQFLASIWNDWSGFKLILSHWAADSYLWDELDGVKIILLHRNMLDACFSYKLATVTDVWQTTGVGQQDAPFHMPLDEVFWFLDHFGPQEDAAAARFGATSLTVRYEEISHDWARCISRVQDFLEIPQQALEPRITKRTLRPFPELVTNYDQIVKAVWASRHGRRLEQGPLLV